MVWKKSEEEENQPFEASSSSEGLSPAKQLKDRAIIGHSIRVKGDVSGNEDMVVHGRVDGTIHLDTNNVTIGPKGEVTADVTAKIISIEGKVEGDLNAQEQVIVRKSGRVLGNIKAPRVCLEDGCKFSGGIDMEGARKGLASSAADKPAIPEKPEPEQKSKDESKSKSAAAL